MPRSYVRLRETTFDLYVERDLLPAYYKIVATLASWFVLAGYVLFAIVFTTKDEDLTAKRSLITALAGAALIVGYVGILLVALLAKSLLFLIDGVLFPTLSASVLGLFLTVVNYALHVRLSISQTHMFIPLVTACVTTVVSALVLLIVYRELGKIRRRDERRRWHLQLGPYSGGNGDPTTLFNVHAQDDEAQRRQLMRLLQDPHETGSHPDLTNNTFKIDLPGQPKYDLPPQQHHDRRASSPGRVGFSLENLMPWKNKKDGTFKDARQKKREEIEIRSMRRDQIERSSVTNRGEAWTTHDPTQYQNTQPSRWPLATRYA